MLQSNIVGPKVALTKCQPWPLISSAERSRSCSPALFPPRAW
jgi:hypothetical protein